MGGSMDLKEPEKPAESGTTEPAEIGATVQAEPPAQGPRPVSRGKLLVGAVLVVILVAGLYLLNRYWISPALKTQAMTSGDHPEAPGISLTDIEGKRLDLADYKGKVVVLDFWATWCGPCRAEIPGFIELQKRYAGQGFSMLGIAIQDEAPSVEEFYKEFKMNYPVAVGTERIAELYGGILGLPTTFLIGRDGRIYVRHTGGVNPALIEEEVQELLAMSPTSEKSDFKPALVAGTETKVEVGDPTTIDSEIPGLNLTKLTAEQKEALKKELTTQHCPCGCNLTVLKCRKVDRSCSTSLKLAKQQLEKSAKPGA